ncbi:uncharacterized protein METZ01_LOCUS214692, partial [marine metagenome]
DFHFYHETITSFWANSVEYSRGQKAVSIRREIGPK